MRFRYVGSALFSLLFALLFAPPAQAQNGTLAGVVTNELGAAVAQAQIELIGGRAGLGVVSDDQGRYRIQLPAGTYDVVVTHVGHQTIRQSNVSVSAGQTTTLDIRMATFARVLDPIVVTGNRRALGAGEPARESPGITDVVSGAEVRERPSPDITDQLVESPGVDRINYGLQASNFVVRGFNNIFSGSLHMLSDYRLAGVPSLRVNLAHFIPTTSEDLERIEVVLGPGSALYGPNTANGIVHIISRSPIDDQGTSVTLSGGAKGKDYPSAFQGAFRSAFLLSDNVGMKVSGQYLDAEEWRYFDPAEQVGDPNVCVADKMARGLSMAEAQVACARIGARNFDIQRYSVEGRIDWRFNDDADGLVATYGRNSSSGIEMTGLGAGQTDDWISDFYQMRLTVDRLFVQGYVNQSDAGDSFLLREGTVLADESKLLVGQIQHGFDLADGRQDFTYGYDYFATRPDSKRSIYGSYEGDNDINEWGVYLQSKTELTEELDFIAALRMDSHSIIPDNVWSPRAAFVYNPTEDQGFHAGYNRAFSTPTALNYFLDIPGGFAPGALGQLGFTTRAYGSGRNGWSVQNPDGTLRGMRSPFNPALTGGPSQLLPADVPVMWQLVVGFLEATNQIDATTAAGLRGVTPADNSAVERIALNPLTMQASPVSSLVLPDMEPTRESYTETFEVGWNGRFDDRFQIVADVYFTRKSDFVSPLLVQTPLLFLDEGTTAAYLTPFFGPGAASALAAGMAQVPAGVVSSDSNGAQGPELVLSYRNVGEVDFWGADVSMEVFLDADRQWRLSGMYSFVSKDEFEIADGTPITLNAPMNKGSLALNYRNLREGLTASGRVRFTGGFPATSAGFVGDVDSYAIVDLTGGYEIPGTAATLQLSVSNLFATQYQTFPGVPEIGRFTMLGVRYELF
ncbi:MAG: TonB-dependent receptor [Longimicrobiales bacterium]|nr:TonB-dependent receptor [Longimicrobiales bacterium]